MTEFQSIIAKYSSNGYALYSKTISIENWGNKIIAEKYFAKYWLSSQEYENIWKPIQRKIFTLKNLPDLVFNSDYDLILLQGGSLFSERDFVEFQKSMIAIGEKYFVIIQNTFDGKLKEAPIRMKYPISISWNELMSGNFVSSIIFEMFHNEFFVFGTSAIWGKYSASDFETPTDIIGVRSNYSNFFLMYLRQKRKNWGALKNLLSMEYRSQNILNE